MQPESLLAVLKIDILGPVKHSVSIILVSVLEVSSKQSKEQRLYKAS